MLPTIRGVKFGHCLQQVFGHTNICDIRPIQFRRVSHALVDIYGNIQLYWIYAANNYINYINLSYQKPSRSRHQSHQCVISETTRVNTSITSMCHIRNHRSQYINHNNLSYEKPPESIHLSYQTVISEATRVNTSVTSICHNINHQSQYIDHINRSYQKPPEAIHRSYLSVISITDNPLITL